MIKQPLLFVFGIDESWFFVGAKNEWLFFYGLLLKWIVVFLDLLSLCFEFCKTSFFKERFLFGKIYDLLSFFWKCNDLNIWIFLYVKELSDCLLLFDCLSPQDQHLFCFIFLRSGSGGSWLQKTGSIFFLLYQIEILVEEAFCEVKNWEGLSLKELWIAFIPFFLFFYLESVYELSLFAIVDRIRWYDTMTIGWFELSLSA